MTEGKCAANKGTAVNRCPRILLAACASGSGKTLITCGILQAFCDRGLRVASFKCGPDYIDPMFHTRVIGTKARNLDSFFTDAGTTRYLLAKGAAEAELSVMEGVMGYYDGLGGCSLQASSYDVARVTQTPVILIVNCRGMSLSVLAQVKGFLEFRADSGIRGVILNQLPERRYPEMKRLLEEELGVKAYGFVPSVPELQLKSRHLGLVTPDEVEGLRENLRKLGQILERTLDLDGLLELARTAPALHDARQPDYDKGSSPEAKEAQMSGKDTEQSLVVDREPPRLEKIEPTPVIAVARDEAFCFLYEENLDLLRELGAELNFFSPLHDRELPCADGLLLCGGYPELYARQLSANRSMRESIRQALENGLPCMAECGGFMYLQEELEDMDGVRHAMVGALSGRSYYTGKLGRFGYITLRPAKEQMLGTDIGEIRAHEFHYFDSTACGDAFHAQKPLRADEWDCIQDKASCIAGFPHLYYYSNPEIAVRFLRTCMQKKCADK